MQKSDKSAKMFSYFNGFHIYLPLHIFADIQDMATLVFS